MSRSRRKQSFTGVTKAVSEKDDKRKVNRALRRRTHVALQDGAGENVFPDMREVSNTWEMAKEGKRHFDPKSAPKWMRK